MDSHHYVMTLQRPQPGGGIVLTADNAITPPTNWTRADVYKAVYSDLIDANPHMAGSHVLFFSLEPNQL